MIEGPVFLKTCKALAGILLSIFAGLHLMIQLFLYAIFFDIVTGLVAAWGTKTVDSELSRKGMAKKVLMVLAVAAAQIMGKAAGLNLEVPWGGEWGAGAAVAGYYAIQESISITENLGRAGLPMPKFVTDRLTKLKELTDK